MLDLIIKNGQSYINGKLEDKDIAVKDGKIIKIGEISGEAKEIYDAKKQIVLPLLYDKLKNVKNDELILLVTHQVVISEITNVSPPSGGIVIYNTKNKKAKLIRNITN